MWSGLAACIDFAHALLMAAWVLGLPLLFVHRWPRATRAYAIYALAFITLNVASRALLGECFLTTLSRACWQAAARAGGRTPVPQEWFTVRLAEAVFRLTPSHRGIKRASEALIFATAIGVLVSFSPLGLAGLRRLRETWQRGGTWLRGLHARKQPAEKRAENQPVPYATSPTRMTTASVPKRPNVA
jgi:hypothetical protein